MIKKLSTLVCLGNISYLQKPKSGFERLAKHIFTDDRTSKEEPKQCAPESQSNQSLSGSGRFRWTDKVRANPVLRDGLSPNSGRLRG